MGADKELNVGVVITYRNEAAGAAGDLENIKGGAEQLSPAIDQLTKALEDATTKLSSAARETTPVGDKAAEAAPKVRNLAEIASGLKTAAEGGDGAAFGLARSLEGLGKAAGVSAGVIGTLTAAFGVGYTVGTLFMTALKKITDDGLPPLNDLGQTMEEVAAAAKELQEHDLDFKNWIAGADKASKALDQLIQKTAQAGQAASQLRDAQTDLGLANIDLAEKKALGGAKSPEERAAISAEYDRQRFDLKAANDIAKADQQIASTTQAIQLKSLEQEHYQAQLTAETKRAQDAMARYAKTVELLEDAGFDPKQLRSHPEKLADAVSQTRGQVDAAAARGDNEEVFAKSALLGALLDLRKSFQDNFNAQNSSKEKQSELITKITELNAEIRELKTGLETTETARKTAEVKQDVQKFDLGAKSEESLNNLTTAIQRANDRLATAQAGLTSAQTTGGGAEQNAAYAEVQAAQAEFNRLNELASQAAQKTVESARVYGQAFDEGAEATKTAAAAAVEKIKKVPEGVKTEADKAAADFEASGDVAKVAMEGATGKISGAVEKMGGDITTSFDRLASQVERSLDSVANRLDAMDNRLKLSDERSAKAAADASLALAQIANTR